jgi:hypothetical protein
MRKNFILFFISVYWCTTVPAVVKARQEMTSQVSRRRGRAPNVAHHVPMDRAPDMVFKSVFNTISCNCYFHSLFLLLFIGLLNELCLGSCGGRAVYMYVNNSETFTAFGGGSVLHIKVFYL